MNIGLDINKLLPAKISMRTSFGSFGRTIPGVISDFKRLLPFITYDSS